MEPRKEPTREPKAPAAGASKAPNARKPGAQSGAGQESGTGAHAGASAGAATGTASRTTGEKPREEDLLQHAKNAKGEIVNQVQQQAGSQVNKGKEIAATELSKVANAVRQFGQNLTENESGAIGRYAVEYGEKAANNLDRLANYIREQDPKRLLNDVQDFGRRQPALLLGGAFILGLAGARLIKSSMNAASQQSLNASGSRRRALPASPNAR